MNKILMLVLMVGLSGCATGYQNAYMSEQMAYSKRCADWKTKTAPELERRSGESSLTTVDLIAKRNQEGLYSDVPRKTQNMKSIEYNWGMGPTEDFCINQ